MSDLAAFLLARLDEDEAVAKDARNAWPESADSDDADPDSALANRHALYEVPNDLRPARHVARHDPARVLREVGAMRRVIRLLGTSGQYGPVEWDPDDEILLAMAAVWSGHPDYDPEWSAQ